MLGLTIARCSRADLEPDPYKTTEPAKPNLYPGDAYQKGQFAYYFSEPQIISLETVEIHLFFQP